MIENNVYVSGSQADNFPATSDSLRVDVTLLDTLMNLAGELVLSRNQLLQGIGSPDMKTIEFSGQRIDMITSELQDAIMKTRMQPVSRLFDKLSPVVSDLGQHYGKTVELITDGKEVELDKTIIETIFVPLKRLVETCIESGIEIPDKRKQSGKKANGRLVLRALHDTSQVNIELSDDGCGKQFQTTPEDVTAGIERLGGTIDIKSKKGAGTDIQIKLPLSQSIIPSQITSVEGEQFAIPQTNLSELIRIPAAEVKDKIEKVGNADVVRLRGELLPLLNLPDILGIEKTYTDASGIVHPDRRDNLADRRSKKHSADGRPLSMKPDAAKELTPRDPADRRNHHSKAVNIAVVFAGDYKYGLVIDQLHDSEEIVVKPLGRHLKKYKAYSGATIMGDGNVALILDILHLAQMAGLSTMAESNQWVKKEQETIDSTSEKESLIIFKNLDTEYFSAPFHSIERIERITSSDIEQVGNRKVIQYRGGTLPLFELSQILNVAPLPEKEQREVIVFNVNGNEFGLMVTPPIDALEISLALDETTLKQKGVTGSMVINNHTTLMLDVAEMAGQFLNEEV